MIVEMCCVETRQTRVQTKTWRNTHETVLDSLNSLLTRWLWSLRFTGTHGNWRERVNEEWSRTWSRREREREREREIMWKRHVKSEMRVVGLEVFKNLDLSKLGRGVFRAELRLSCCFLWIFCYSKISESKQKFLNYNYYNNKYLNLRTCILKMVTIWAIMFHLFYVNNNRNIFSWNFD